LFYVLFDRFGTWVAKLAKRGQMEDDTHTLPDVNGVLGTQSAADQAEAPAAAT